MKRSILLFGALSLALMGCDKVDDPLKDDFGFADFPENATKVILLEEFTGVSCNNCPTAAKRAEGYVQSRPDNIVVVGVHAGGFSVPDAQHPADFRTDDGKDLFDFFQPIGVPSGLFDRVDYPTSHSKLLFDWDDTFNSRLAVEGNIEIGSTLSYDATTEEFKISINLAAVSSITATELHLSAYLVEDGIISPQTQPDNSIKDDYEHNHVLRAAFGDAGVFGTKIGALAEGQVLSRTFTVKKDKYNKQPYWDPNNCSAIVFVYDKDTYLVQQAYHVYQQ